MLKRRREKKDILVIFDCDGVLVDSEAITARIEHQALQNRGCLLSMDDYLERALGLADEDLIWNTIAAEWDVKLPVDFGDRLRAIADAALAEELLPIKGVKEMLNVLPYEKCIASSATPERLTHTLSLTGIDGIFKGKCFSGTLVSRGKPAPDVFLYAAGKMGFEPCDCIVVEDSINGVKAAVDAGMTVLGFTGASHCRPGLKEILTGLGCWEIFSEMEDFPALIQKNMRS